MRAVLPALYLFLGAKSQPGSFMPIETPMANVQDVPRGTYCDDGNDYTKTS